MGEPAVHAEKIAWYQLQTKAHILVFAWQTNVKKAFYKGCSKCNWMIWLSIALSICWACPAPPCSGPAVKAIAWVETPNQSSSQVLKQFC